MVRPPDFTSQSIPSPEPEPGPNRSQEAPQSSAGAETNQPGTIHRPPLARTSNPILK